MTYSVQKLTVKKRSTIKSGAVCEVEVNEQVVIPFIKAIDKKAYGQFFLRKKFAVDLTQKILTPFPQGYSGVPLVMVKNDSVGDIELLAGEELGEVWIFVG